MTVGNDEEVLYILDREQAAEADRFAQEMDEIMLDIDDLDPVSCPPDRRISRGDHEAWIYEHGNIAELVFVKL